MVALVALAAAGCGWGRRLLVPAWGARAVGSVVGLLLYCTRPVRALLQGFRVVRNGAPRSRTRRVVAPIVMPRAAESATWAAVAPHLEYTRALHGLYVSSYAGTVSGSSLTSAGVDRDGYGSRA